jgi:hypothetical protein
MRALTQYVSWEMLAIHLLTGALYAVVTAVVALALLPERWIIAVVLMPFVLFGWWGWWAEARFVRQVSSDLRRL